MSKLRKFIARVYDLPNAFRVLDIMDKCGCDISEVDRPGFTGRGYWEVTTKWYVSKQEAEDLQKIVLFKHQYRKRNRIWIKLFFGEFRDGCRILQSWV